MTGRFLTRDPIGYGGGINLYGFAGNNPVNESDPSGFYVDDNHRYGFGKPVAGVNTLIPLGANIFNNLKEAQAEAKLVNGEMEYKLNYNANMEGNNTFLEQHALLYDWYIEQVKTGHRWDYKNFPTREHSYIDPGKKRGTYLYDNFGNFNAGAVAAALGLSLKEARGGADVFHVIDHWRHPATDVEDHGDDWIKKGYDWYTKNHPRR